MTDVFSEKLDHSLFLIRSRDALVHHLCVTVDLQPVHLFELFADIAVFL